MDFNTFTACFFMLACFLKLSDAAVSQWDYIDSAAGATTDTAAPPAGTYALSIAEGQAVGTRLFTAAATATTGPTYSFDTNGNPGSVGSLDASTGEVTLAAGMSLDFETTPSIIFLIKATETTDTTVSGVATVTLTVTDAIVFGQSSYLVCLSSTSLASGYSIGTFADTDATTGQTVAYTSASGADFAKFTVTSGTGAVVTAVALTSEEKMMWVFDITGTATVAGTTTVYVALGCSSGAGQIAALTGALLLSLFASLFC